jgi:Conjugal transfer protein TraD
MMETDMRKPRDFDSELQALNEKAKLLKSRKVLQLGELVIATGADALDAEILTGALLGVVKAKDTKEREAWRVSGAAFFQRQSRAADSRTPANADSDQKSKGDDAQG